MLVMVLYLSTFVFSENYILIVLAFPKTAFWHNDSHFKVTINHINRSINMLNQSVKQLHDLRLICVMFKHRTIVKMPITGKEANYFGVYLNRKT